MSLSYLWLRDQDALIQEMIDSQMDARIVEVRGEGLKAKHLGKSITEMQESFRMFHKGFGFNINGEGGEYKTAVFDCPLFKKKIVCTDHQTILHDGEDQKTPVCSLKLNALSLEPKSPHDIAKHAQIITDRIAAVEATQVEVIDEVKEFEFKPTRVIDVPNAKFTPAKTS